MAEAFTNDARADGGTAPRVPQELERRGSDASWCVTAFRGGDNYLDTYRRSNAVTIGRNPWERFLVHN